MPGSDKPKKNRAAVALGRRGGKARARNLTKERIQEIGRHAAEVRWRKPKPLN